MKSQNKKNLYKILVNSIIRKEFSKDEINDILRELNIDEITWERIRKEINKRKEKEEKKRMLEEEEKKKIKDEREKRNRETKKRYPFGFYSPP